MRVEINEKGLSIVEVVIALGVITIGLMGVFSLVLQNIQVQGLNKNYLVASMLAQEGIELARNVRDTNFLRGDPFNQTLSTEGAITTFTIDIDLNINNTANLVTDNYAVLYLSAAGKYNHTSGDQTMYSRLITVNKVSNDYLEVHSLVEWKEHERTHDYEVVTYLYNWW